MGREGGLLSISFSLGREIRFVGTVIAAIFLAPGKAGAVAELIVQLEGGPTAQQLSVDILSPDGVNKSYHDEDADGVLLVDPGGSAGEYAVTLKLGEQRETQAVSLPDSGLVTLVYRPSSPGEKLVVAYSRQDFGNEEIIVTARKREENLQSTPISVTALTETVLRESSMKNLRNVGDTAPNVHFSVSSGINGAPSEASVFIRGIGHLGTGVFQDPAVGIYVDGVYVARAQGSVFDLLDLERVEVLRGPQGTLFGKNTIGGAVSLVTRKPDSGFAADLELTLGDLDRRDLKGKISGPLTGSIFGSLAALTTRRDGYARSLAIGREYNNDDRFVARGALRFLISDNTVLDLSGDYTRERIDGLDQVLVDVGDENPNNFVVFYNQVMGSAGFPTYSEDFVSDNLYESFSGSPNVHNGDAWGLTLHIDSTFKSGNLTSISAFRKIDFDDISDRDGIPQIFVDVAARQKQEQFSQELRWNGLAFDDRLNWTVGTLFFSEDSESRATTTIFDGLFEALEAAPGAIFSLTGPENPCDPGPASTGTLCFGGAGNPLNLAFGTGFLDTTDQQVKSYALFGQGTWAASSRVSLTFGIRSTFEEKDFSFDRISLPLNTRENPQREDDWDALSPKLGVEFQITPEHLVYGSLSWGFKSGGFNGIIQGSDTLEPFGPEKIVAYEAGFKTDWLENRLRINGAIFLNDYTDIQFTSARISETGMISFPIQNAGEAETKGVELELSARPTRGFELTGGVGYLDTEYTELRNPGPGGPTINGVFPKAPEWTVHLAPQWTYAIGSPGDVRFRVDYSYRSEVFQDIINSATAAQEGYPLWSARVAFLHASERWELAVFGTNLSDEEYIEHGIFVAGFGPTLVVAGRPREWGMNLRFRF